MAGKRRMFPARRAAAFAVAASVWFAGACSGGAATRAPHPGRAHTARPVAGFSVGWPMRAPDYFGRYRMTSSSDPAFAGSGLLTLFMRKVTKPKKLTLPSGVLSVFGRGETTVLYLTKLRHRGTHGLADVSAGNYTYAPMGRVRLVGFDTRRHTLTLLLAPGRGRPVKMSFVRYSSDPHP